MLEIGAGQLSFLCGEGLFQQKRKIRLRKQTGIIEVDEDRLDEDCHDVDGDFVMCDSAGELLQNIETMRVQKEESRKQNSSFSFWSITHSKYWKKKVYNVDQLENKLKLFLNNFIAFNEEITSTEKLISSQKYKIRKQVPPL